MTGHTMQSVVRVTSWKPSYSNRQTKKNKNDNDRN